MKMRRTRKKPRSRQQRDCWLCLVAVKLLFLSWLWYWNLSILSSEQSLNNGIPISIHIQENRDDDCPPYGCPVTPPEMTSVKPSVLIKKVATSYGNETMATMTRESNRQHPPVNQDAAVVFAPFTTLQTTHDHDFLLTLTDGHGTQGHFVAQYASKAVPERLAEKFNEHATLQTDEWIVKALKDTFVEVDAEAPPSALLGGCTASVTLQRGNRLFIANTGDSRTIVVSTSDDTEEVSYMTRKDKPHLPDEHERITKLGGKVHIPPQNPMLSRVIVYSDAAHDQIGLAMSRSIGDWEWGAVGVTAEPLVDVLNVDNLTNAFVLAASDGLWDVRRPQFVAKHFADSFYRHGKSPLATCQDMIQKASPVKENVYRDDITIIAMKIT